MPSEQHNHKPCQSLNTKTPLATERTNNKMHVVTIKGKIKLHKSPQHPHPKKKQNFLQLYPMHLTLENK
jgi:hypothetical protein